MRKAKISIVVILAFALGGMSVADAALLASKDYVDRVTSTKQQTLTAGTGISIVNGVISCTLSPGCPAPYKINDFTYCTYQDKDCKIRKHCFNSNTGSFYLGGLYSKEEDVSECEEYECSEADRYWDQPSGSWQMTIHPRRPFVESGFTFYAACRDVTYTCTYTQVSYTVKEGVGTSNLPYCEE